MNPTVVQQLKYNNVKVHSQQATAIAKANFTAIRKIVETNWVQNLFESQQFFESHTLNSTKIKCYELIKLQGKSQVAITTANEVEQMTNYVRKSHLFFQKSS